MGSQYTPGNFERILNPTFGVFQQPLWRIWRAMEDEDIDLFSKQGLMDPALLPGLGVMFSPENSVMPDELFGDRCSDSGLSFNRSFVLYDCPTKSWRYCR